MFRLRLRMVNLRYHIFYPIHIDFLSFSEIIKDIKAVTTAYEDPMANDPAKIPRKFPTDWKNAAASNVLGFSLGL